MSFKMISNGKELSYPNLRLLAIWVLCFSLGYYTAAVFGS